MFFLELSCFFHDPVDVGNLISGSSAFFKTSLNIGKWGCRCGEEGTDCSFCFSPTPANASLLLGACDEVPALQFSSVAQSCPTLCNPMNCSTPGLPVHHQLPEFTQTHVHRLGDSIQPSHPVSSPSPPAPNASQLQSLFQ